MKLIMVWLILYQQVDNPSLIRYSPNREYHSDSFYLAIDKWGEFLLSDYKSYTVPNLIRKLDIKWILTILFQSKLPKHRIIRCCGEFFSNLIYLRSIFILITQTKSVFNTFFFKIIPNSLSLSKTQKPCIILRFENLQASTALFTSFAIQTSLSFYSRDNHFSWIMIFLSSDNLEENRVQSLTISGRFFHKWHCRW